MPQSELQLDDEVGLVGARGFEPPTSSSRTMRATKLRHAPTECSTEPADDSTSIVDSRPNHPNHTRLSGRWRRATPIGPALADKVPIPTYPRPGGCRGERRSKQIHGDLGITDVFDRTSRTSTTPERCGRGGIHRRHRPPSPRRRPPRPSWPRTLRLPAPSPRAPPPRTPPPSPQPTRSSPSPVAPAPVAPTPPATATGRGAVDARPRRAAGHHAGPGSAPVRDPRAPARPRSSPPSTRCSTSAPRRSAGGSRAIVDRIVGLHGFAVTREERLRLVEQMVHEITGLGPLEPLLCDETITEVMVNGPRQIYIERGGKIQRVDVHFQNDEHVRRIIDRIITPIGRRIDESSPRVDARLPDGSRVNAVIAPLSLVGPVITVRKFSATPFTVEDLIRFGTATAEMFDFLRPASRPASTSSSRAAPAPARRRPSMCSPRSSPRKSGSSPSRTPPSCSSARPTS